jgi:hypothetical protein
VSDALRAATLTDDELVAISLGRARVWPLPLPTVDSSSETELRAAAFRGRRSLTVRELLPDRSNLAEGDADPLQQLLAPAVKAEPLVILYVADETMQWDLSGPTIGLYASTDGPESCLVEAVTADGRHLLELAPGGAAGQMFRQLATDAYARGIAAKDAKGGPVRILWLCLTVPGDPPRSLRMGEGRAEWVQLDAAGAIIGDPEPAGSVDVALDLMLQGAELVVGSTSQV